MEYINGVWNRLELRADSGVSSFLNGLGYRFSQKKKENGPVKYLVPRAYKNVYVFEAKRLAIQEAERALQAILPAIQLKRAEKNLEYVRKQQENNYNELIKNGRKVADDYTYIETKEGNIIRATDKYGHIVDGALFLYYDDDEGGRHVTSNYQEVVAVAGNKNQSSVIVNEITTETITHIDLSPDISMSSKKNVVLTEVTGRDYSRKELVSGGDFEFKINGSIVSNNDYAYPYEKVKAFVKIMQHNGIVKIKNAFLGNMNIKQVIITDFSMSKQEFVNIQPYSFSCVAVEPDEDIVSVKDTIVNINEVLSKSPSEKWYNALLGSKRQEILNGISNAGTSIAMRSVSEKLDNLMPNSI